MLMVGGFVAIVTVGLCTINLREEVCGALVDNKVFTSKLGNKTVSLTATLMRANRKFVTNNIH